MLTPRVLFRNVSLYATTYATTYAGSKSVWLHAGSWGCSASTCPGVPPLWPHPIQSVWLPGNSTWYVKLQVVMIGLEFNRRLFCVAPYPYPPPQMAMLPSPGPPSAVSENMGLVVRGTSLVRPNEDEQPPMRWEPGKDCTYYSSFYMINRTVGRGWNRLALFGLTKGPHKLTLSLCVIVFRRTCSGPVHAWHSQPKGPAPSFTAAG